MCHSKPTRKPVRFATMLRPGDRVMWRGCWGSDEPRPAVIERITVGGKYSSEEVDAVPWSDVRWKHHGRDVVVELEGMSTWAYGFQLTPWPRERRGTA